MKLKKLWIPMLILTVIGGGIKICDTVFNVYGDNSFIFNSTVCNTILTVSAAILLITGWIFSIIDMKKVFDVQPTKNFLCGLFGFISSLTIISGGIIGLLSENPNIAHCILSLAGGGIFLLESCVSFTGHNTLSKVPVLSLIVPIWCCSRFLVLFIEYTHKSIVATEMFDILAVAALLMFLFYHSMFFAGLNNTAAVRKSTVYGMLYVSLGLTVAADLFIKMFMPSNAVAGIDSEVVLPTLSNILAYSGDIALCIYALIFNASNLKIADKTFTVPEEGDIDEIKDEKTEDKKEDKPVEEKFDDKKDDKPVEEKTDDKKDDKPAEEKAEDKKEEKSDK